MFLKIVVAILLMTNFQNLNGLSVVDKEIVPFTFEDSPPQPPAAPIMMDNDLTRQLINGTGLGYPPPGPLPPYPGPGQVITPAIITPGVITPGTTCICVPAGRCTTSPSTSDGSGVIDIRIVTGLLSVQNVTTGGISTGSSQITPVPSQTTCQAGLERCCQAGAYQCGRRYTPIPGSRPAAPGQADFGEYPWQAILLGAGDVYVGSGALIDSLFVLTAAHRVQALVNQQLKVRLGDWDAASETEPIRPQEYAVARIIIHPSFNSGNLKNDVALLKLAAPVQLGTTPTITTACLPATVFTGSRCWVAGWGKNDFNAGAFQAIQKEVDVPVKSPAECQAALSSTRLGAGFVFDSASFVCAGGEVGKDACTGDGGSPLICELSGRWFVTGMVAWGIGCGASGVPGVYVNTATYVPWILSTMSSN